MPNKYDEFPEEETEEPEEDEYYEQLKEEQDDLNSSDDFVEAYGFEHNCRCAEDWAEGNLGIVSLCYLDMCREALDHLKETREELAASRATEAELRVMLADA